MLLLHQPVTLFLGECALKFYYSRSGGSFILLGLDYRNSFQVWVLQTVFCLEGLLGDPEGILNVAFHDGGVAGNVLFLKINPLSLIFVCICR